MIVKVYVLFWIKQKMVLDIEFDGFVLDLVCYICYEDFFFCSWMFERIFIYLRMKSK